MKRTVGNARGQIGKICKAPEFQVIALGGSLDTRVKDWLTDQSKSGVSLSTKDLRKASAIVIFAISLIWLALFTISRVFPYVENGAASVGEIKFDIAKSPKLFGSDASTRVLAFGNSQILAGFEPKVFANGFPLNFKSVYNLAIPGDERYLSLLEATLKANNIPSQILVQFLPAESDKTDLWETVKDNKKMLSLLFPFKDYFRDMIVFAFEAGGPSGFVRQYHSNVAQIEGLLKQHGYYFIKSQSHFENDELPPDYRLPTDQPNSVLRRTIDTQNSGFQRLVELARQYHFKIFVVPVAYRIGAYKAPPSVDPDFNQALASFDCVQVVGPPYFLFEPKYFSDPVHLNPIGAERYTGMLTNLMRQATLGDN